MRAVEGKGGPGEEGSRGRVRRGSFEGGGEGFKVEGGGGRGLRRGEGGA